MHMYLKHNPTRLSLELIGKIADYLAETSDLLSLGLSSKKLAALIIPSHLFYHTISGRLDQPQLWIYLISNPTICRYIRRIEVTGPTNKTENPKMRLLSVDTRTDHPYKTPESKDPLLKTLWAFELIALVLRQTVYLEAFRWLVEVIPIFNHESDLKRSLPDIHVLERLHRGQWPQGEGSYGLILNPAIVYPFCNVVSFTLTSIQDGLDCGESIVKFLITCPKLKYLDLHICHQSFIGDFVSLGRWPDLQILSLSVRSDYSTPNPSTVNFAGEFFGFHHNLTSLKWRIGMKSNFCIRDTERFPMHTTLPSNCLSNLQCLDGDHDLVQLLIGTACTPHRRLKKIIDFPWDHTLWKEPEQSFQGIDPSSVQLLGFTLDCAAQFMRLFPDADYINDTAASTPHPKPFMFDKFWSLKRLKIVLSDYFWDSYLGDEVNGIESHQVFRWINEVIPPTVEADEYMEQNLAVVFTREGGSVNWKWYIVQSGDMYIGKDESFAFPEDYDRFAL